MQAKFFLPAGAQEAGAGIVVPEAFGVKAQLKSR